MKPIAIFYHCLLSGGTAPVNADAMFDLIQEQMNALNLSGLSSAAEFISIGVNTAAEDADAVAALHGIVPEKSELRRNEGGVAELPTLRHMQRWCQSHPGWLVLYHHSKGATRPATAWRTCMERAVVWNWKWCVNDLMAGCDSVGVHWLAPDRFPFIGKTPYWGGNFWWATSDFINTLPTVDVNADRYEAELWIGKGPRQPKVKDYAPHFPMSGCQ